MTIDYLQQLGIQRWRRRAFATNDSPSAESAESATSAEPAVIAPQIDGQPEKDSWAAVIADMQAANACPSCQASVPILGEGDLSADWVFVIDAPSSRDIAEQALLQGRAGILFDSILKAAGLQRESVYLTSIFKCPPSESYELGATCGHLVTRQINLIEPQNILAFGEFAGQALLRSNEGLVNLRARLHQPRSVIGRVVVSHSLTELLAAPILKAELWQDISYLLQS